MSVWWGGGGRFGGEEERVWVGGGVDRGRR